MLPIDYSQFIDNPPLNFSSWTVLIKYNSSRLDALQKTIEKIHQMKNDGIIFVYFQLEKGTFHHPHLHAFIYMPNRIFQAGKRYSKDGFIVSFSKLETTLDNFINYIKKEHPLQLCTCISNVELSWCRDVCPSPVFAYTIQNDINLFLERHPLFLETYEEPIGPLPSTYEDDLQKAVELMS